MNIHNSGFRVYTPGYWEDPESSAKLIKLLAKDFHWNQVTFGRK